MKTSLVVALSRLQDFHGCQREQSSPWKNKVLSLKHSDWKPLLSPSWVLPFCIKIKAADVFLRRFHLQAGEQHTHGHIIESNNGVGAIRCDNVSFTWKPLESDNCVLYGDTSDDSTLEHDHKSWNVTNLFKIDLKTLKITPDLNCKFVFPYLFHSRQIYYWLLSIWVT